MAEDGALNIIGEHEQLKYKIADIFDKVQPGRESANGRRITIDEIFGKDPSMQEQYAFYEVEYTYYLEDPSLDNPLCYWNKIPRNKEEVDRVNALAGEENLSAMLILAQGFAEYGKQQESIGWFVNAANLGSSQACVRLGEAYLYGDGVERDPKQALQCFEAAIKMTGDSTALCRLGHCYISGEGVEEDVQKGLSLLERSARQGNSYARYYLGLLYRDGKLVEQDYMKALKWYELSAWGYNIVSFTDLINLLLSTESPEKALVDRALFWAKLYYDRGEPRAYYIMGRFYQDGLGVEQDKEKGEKLLRKAADMDDSYAAYHLSNMLYETDKEASMEYFKKAVSLGYSGAEFEYGTMIWDEDRSRATEFIMSAVAKGFQPAIDFAYGHDLLPKE